MTWVKLEEAVRLDMRAKIAVITKQDFVNLTDRPIEEFFSLVLRGENVATVEEIVREVLTAMYPESIHWTITQIGFSLGRQSVEVVVEHPSFEKVHPAYELPRLPNYGFTEMVSAGDEIHPQVVAIESPESGEHVIFNCGDGRVGVVPDEPVAIPTEASGWRPVEDWYASGFAVGDAVVLVAGKRKYNPHIHIPVGSLMTVIEPPNRDGWPDDAVQIEFGTGQGAVDASLLRHAS